MQAHYNDSAVLILRCYIDQISFGCLAELLRLSDQQMVGVDQVRR